MEKAIVLLCDELESFNIRPTEEQKNQFMIYMKELIRWSSLINLTTIVKPVDIAIKHFLDSILFQVGAGPILKKDVENIVDIGSGAGFPGLPLLILDIEKHLTIIEKDRKKCTFLLNLVGKLSLANRVEVICQRAEADFPFKCFNTVLMRAVKLDSDMLEILDALLFPGGRIVYGLGRKTLHFDDHLNYTISEQEFFLPVFNHNRKIITLIKPS